MGALFGINNNQNPIQNPQNPQQQRLIDPNNMADDINLLNDHPKIKKTKAYKNPTLLKRNTIKLVKLIIIKNRKEMLLTKVYFTFNLSTIPY